ncbi:thiol reductant ABC exporter subunit CydC [Virgibacillus sp. C22-A2]|uniref:Thiol reductant ABC exporter subunit CydC n=1 Tax=Virgibacillus tibetensis TaxID=3042313 RepID=A0ABU6KER4_9BACI|nr:thiol reductant ABC exporter subunit CydC [Virgibacillus sp. C22-A2]
MKDLVIIIRLILVEKKDVFLSVLFGFITGIAAVALFASSGYLISKAALAPPLYTLTLVIASVKLLGITRAVGRYAERYFSHRATFTMLSNLRVSFFNRLEPLAPGIFQKYRSGDLLSRIVGDVETLQNFFLRVFYPPIVLLIVFLSTIFFTTFYSLPIALILLAGLVMTSFVVPVLFAINQRRIYRHVRQSRGELSTEVTEFLYGFRDLKIYQQLNKKEEQLTQFSKVYIDEQEREGVHLIFSQSVNTFVSFVVSWSVIALGAFLVTEGQLDGVFLAMLVMISLTVFENAAPMAAFPSHLEDSRSAAKRLFSVVSKNESEENKPQKSMDKLSLQQGPSISVKDVSFTFPGESRKTLEDVSVTMAAGSKTAIVGPSGSGKSTLMQLLLKIYPADQGDIQLDKIGINQLTQESIWENSTVVLQENHFFYGTIRDNLQLAKDGLSDEEMQAVLEKVKLGYFSVESDVLEKGGNLSGGEKQRLAIARAMLKEAPLWCLDEPTSSIDALTEAYIYDHLFQQATNDTVILISHRLTGLEKMDQIIVMEKGTIVETGTFDELMEKKGYFYEMKQIEKSVFM